MPWIARAVHVRNNQCLLPADDVTQLLMLKCATMRGLSCAALYFLRIISRSRGTKKGTELSPVLGVG
jgi:hypothetical protein